MTDIARMYILYESSVQSRGYDRLRLSTLLTVNHGRVPDTARTGDTVGDADRTQNVCIMDDVIVCTNCFMRCA